MWGRRIFKDRSDAGRRLAEKLQYLKNEDVVVLALPRGGVPIGFEVAKMLCAPLDVLIVRKIGAPSQPELAIGAVVDGDPPETVLNDDIIRALGIDDDAIAYERGRQLEEIERRRQRYGGGRRHPTIENRTVVLVDDGIATGATVRAALRGLRRKGPKALVLAVPVGPPDTLDRLRSEVDEIVCLEAPENFGAIGVFYEDFRQMDDDEVLSILGSWDQREENKGGR